MNWSGTRLAWKAKRRGNSLGFKSSIFRYLEDSKLRLQAGFENRWGAKASGSIPTSSAMVSQLNYVSWKNNRLGAESVSKAERRGNSLGVGTSFFRRCVQRGLVIARWLAPESYRARVWTAL